MNFKNKSLSNHSKLLFLRESLDILRNFNAQIISEASKKDILIKKLGFSEDKATKLERLAGSLSVLLAKKLIEQHKNLLKTIAPPNIEINDDTTVNSLNTNSTLYFQRYTPVMTEIMDWVRVGLDGNLGEFKNLNLRELQVQAKKWHDSLEMGQAKINYEEKNRIIIDFRNKKGEGFYWVNLQTNNSPEECERMGHCGRTGYNNLLYSLREVKKLPNKKYTINKSHLTASIGKDGTLYQLKGPKNSKPKEEYNSLILPLFYYEDEDGDYLIDDFGNEYDAANDFKLSDLSNQVLIDLYNQRPELFESRKLQRKLIELGVIEGPKIDYIINIEMFPSEVNDFVRGDWTVRSRKRKTPAGNEYLQKIGLFEVILSGDAWDLWDNYSYFDWKSALDYSVNDKNEKLIKEIIHSKAKKQNPDLTDEELNSTPLEDLIEEYDDEYDIQGAIKSAGNSAESNDYVDYLYKNLKEALEELGTVKEMNDEKVVLEINMKPYLDNLDSYYYDEYMDRCDDDLKCVFGEMIDNEIDKPKFDYDDRFTPDMDDNYFNDLLNENLYDVQYRMSKQK